VKINIVVVEKVELGSRFVQLRRGELPLRTVEDEVGLVRVLAPQIIQFLALDIYYYIFSF